MTSLIRIGGTTKITKPRLNLIRLTAQSGLADESIREKAQVSFVKCLTAGLPT